MYGRYVWWDQINLYIKVISYSTLLIVVKHSITHIQFKEQQNGCPEEKSNIQIRTRCSFAFYTSCLVYFLSLFSNPFLLLFIYFLNYVLRCHHRQHLCFVFLLVPTQCLHPKWHVRTVEWGKSQEDACHRKIWHVNEDAWPRRHY